jgi:hypothetical protein
VDSHESSGLGPSTVEVSGGERGALNFKCDTRPLNYGLLEESGDDGGVISSWYMAKKSEVRFL